MGFVRQKYIAQVAIPRMSSRHVPAAPAHVQRTAVAALIMLDWEDGLPVRCRERRSHQMARSAQGFQAMMALQAFRAPAKLWRRVWLLVQRVKDRTLFRIHLANFDNFAIRH